MLYFILELELYKFYVFICWEGMEFMGYLLFIYVYE